MEQQTVSIKRLFLCTAIVALPISFFGGLGPAGLVTAIFIAIPLSIACLIASREQLQSMAGIAACTFAGIFFSMIFSAVGRPVEIMSQTILFAVVGCVIGVVWSERFYARKRYFIPLDPGTRSFEQSHSDPEFPDS